MFGDSTLTCLLVPWREAARKASAFAEDGTFIETKEALRLPGFEKVIGFAVQKALEDWRDEALEGKAPCPSLLFGLSFGSNSAVLFTKLCNALRKCQHCIYI